jgi:uncharacterized protein (DUF952 family)
MFSKDKDAQTKELTRLDQSVPSGALAGCVSGFGVHDQTGNLDEWVVSDRPPAEKSEYSGLMGGAWGHVRNQCRPMTTSHYPHENYYFWSFRCCKDAEGAPSWHLPECKGPDCPIPAPAIEAHDFAPDPIVVTGAPGPSPTEVRRQGAQVVREPAGRRDALALRWLFHIVRAGEGPAAPGAEGFVHCSYRDAVAESARLYFPAGARLSVLQIDPRRLSSPVEEVGTPRGKMPHVIGPIDALAVEGELDLAEVAGAPDVIENPGEPGGMARRGKA